MLRGFYTAASGMIAQQRQQEALSNNIANANTPGYRADQTPLRAFPEMLMEQFGSKKVGTKQLNIPTSTLLGSMNSGVYVQETIPDFRQGDLYETGMVTDLALQQNALPDENGGLFFTVTDANGDVRYTRNGHFTVDGQGYLVTTQGYYVQDADGNRIQTNHMDFTVNNEGIIELENGNVTLGISYVANAHDLVKEGNDIFRGDGAEVPGEAVFSVQQGHLERSNVDVSQSVAQMMSAYRMFESNQRVLKAYDESMSKAVSEIGRIG